LFIGQQARESKVILTRLRLAQLRCFQSAEVELAPAINVFIGGNGTGKSSLIEAVHLLSYGRSFRGRVRDGLIRTGSAYLELYAEWQDDSGRSRRAGLRHQGNAWEARLDGEAAPSLAELCAELAVVMFEPGSHELIGGSAEHRRRFLDWGLFHVEPRFWPIWRRYARALKQRNALLKSKPSAAALNPWDHELAEAGEPLLELRQAYLERLEPTLSQTLTELLPELGPARIEFRPGWKRNELSLADALLLQRDRDKALGYTSVGPHRIDWQVGYQGLPGGEALSRGQEKLTALACVLAQARYYASDRGAWPIICLDDLASELDRVHQRQLVATLSRCQAQVLLTGTEAPAVLQEMTIDHRLFHVEQNAGVATVRPE
jgi:DNA replication and repair protein RecF